MPAIGELQSRLAFASQGPIVIHWQGKILGTV